MTPEMEEIRIKPTNSDALILRFCQLPGFVVTLFRPRVFLFDMNAPVRRTYL
jgi:hypothetical protein